MFVSFQIATHAKQICVGIFGPSADISQISSGDAMLLLLTGGAGDVKAQDLVKVDRHYFRPTEVDALLGDATKARQALGWRPETSFASGPDGSSG
jgi:GDPmannose 4,6-dehydratase